MCNERQIATVLNQASEWICIIMQPPERRFFQDHAASGFARRSSHADTDFGRTMQQVDLQGDAARL
jgi:hypothetical protein